MSIRISIADSNADSSDLWERLLSGGGFEVRVVASGELLMNHVRTPAPDVIVVPESSALLKSDPKAVK